MNQSRAAAYGHWARRSRPFVPAPRPAPIRTHEPVAEPDALIIQDLTLLHQPGLLAGLVPDSYMLVNSTRQPGDLGLDDYLARTSTGHQLVVPATQLGPGAPGPVAAGRPAARRHDALRHLFEARRCLSCGNCFECDNCYGVCPDNAVVKLGPGERYEIDLDYGKGCGICVHECPGGSIKMVPEQV